MKQAFVHTLYEKYAVELKRFISFKFRSCDDHEDIIQDTFHNIMGLEDVERITNPKAYLYQTAHNLALNRIRKINRHESFQNLIKNDDSSPSPEGSAQAQRDLTKLESSINSLPKQWKRAFLLNRVEYKSYKEVAEIMELSVKTVEKHLSNALRQLNKELDR